MSRLNPFAANLGCRARHSIINTLQICLEIFRKKAPHEPFSIQSLDKRRPGDHTLWCPLPDRQGTWRDGWTGLATTERTFWMRRATYFFLAVALLPWLAAEGKAGFISSRSTLNAALINPVTEGFESNLIPIPSNKGPFLLDTTAG